MRAEADLSGDLLRNIVYHFGAEGSFIEEIFECSVDHIHSKQFTLADFIGISDRLGVSLENLVNGTINWAALKKKFKDGEAAIPDEYLRDGGTFMSSLRSMLSFVSFRYGEQATEVALQHLQLSREAIRNDALFINTHVINELFRFLIDRFQFSKADIELMAIIVHRFSPRSAVIGLAKNCKTDRDILRTVVANASRYELNFDYHLEELDDGMIMHSRSKKPMTQGKDSPAWMDDSVALFKVATVKQMPALLGRGPFNVEYYEVGQDRHHQEFSVKILCSGGREVSLH